MQSFCRDTAEFLLLVHFLQTLFGVSVVSTESHESLLYYSTAKPKIACTLGRGRAMYGKWEYGMPLKAKPCGAWLLPVAIWWWVVTP